MVRTDSFYCPTTIDPKPNNQRQLDCNCWTSSCTRPRMTSRIDTMPSNDLPFGSSILHSSIFGRNFAGQNSAVSHPIVMILSACVIMSGVRTFGLLLLMSIPICLKASMTSGFTELAGLVPALIAWNSAGLSLLKIASAIWLRPAFPTQTKRIVRVNSWLPMECI